MTRQMQHLVPFFCGKCGNRLGWHEEEGHEQDGYYGYCDSCAEEKDEEIEGEIEANTHDDDAKAWYETQEAAIEPPDAGK